MAILGFFLFCFVLPFLNVRFGFVNSTNSWLEGICLGVNACKSFFPFQYIFTNPMLSCGLWLKCKYWAMQPWLCQVRQGIVFLFVDGDLAVSTLGPISFKNKFISCVPIFLDLFPCLKFCFYFEISLLRLAFTPWPSHQLPICWNYRCMPTSGWTSCLTDLFPPFLSSAPFSSF